MTPVSLRTGTPVSLRTGSGLRCLLLAALVLGCTPAGPAAHVPLGPVIVLNPPAAPVAGPGRVPPGAASPAAVVRDTAALRGQATRYVVRHDANPAVIDRLTTLTLQSRRAVERLQAMRTGRGYRQEDVIAARVAADTLAAFLQTQSRIAPASSAPTPPFSEAKP